MIHIAGPNSTSTLTNVQEGDIQPNAVDLRVAKVLRITQAPMVLSEESKIHRGSKEIMPDNENSWFLVPGSYEVVMENVIEVGPDEAGFVITRSTLNRNGVFLTSGLYDSGYHGMMAACMHVNVGPLLIKRGTRIGQYLNFKAEALSKYDGSYGLGKQHDEKYKVSE